MAMVFSNSSNKSFGDRFIPNRCNFNVEIAHFKLSCTGNHNKKKNNDIFNLKPKHLNIYRELLQSTLNYHYSPIYSFKNSPNAPKKIERKSQSKSFSQWPCMPRKYPILSKPDIILDWPNVHQDIYWNIVDWGSNGYLATIWFHKVFLWRNKLSQKEEVMDTNIQAFGALKWNHAGTQLAVGGRAAKLTVWAFPEKKVVFASKCDFHQLYSNLRCTISCIAWDRTDALLISGCCSGFLMVWDTVGTALVSVRGHRNNRIITLVFCASNKYVCSSGTDGMVRIWIWPNLEPHVEINYCSPVRAIAFHPWRSALLAVGGGLGDGSLSLWNVNTCQQVAQLIPERDSAVDCLAWSPITGELVSSHHLPMGGPNEEGNETRVLVLAALDRVVDCLEDNHGRVLYLAWDKTGERLATACSDESLCIWNFLGNTTKNCGTKNRSKRQTEKSVLSNFGKCIR